MNYSLLVQEAIRNYLDKLQERRTTIWIDIVSDGALIRNIILPETSLTISELAKRCGVARNTMSKVINERGDVTEDLAIRLSRVLGSSPRFWIRMQTNLNLWQLEQENKRIYQKMERVSTHH